MQWRTEQVARVPVPRTTNVQVTEALAVRGGVLVLGGAAVREGERPLAVRLGADGRRDRAFALLAPGAPAATAWYAGAVLRNGRVAVATEAVAANGRPHLRVARLTATGRADRTFATVPIRVGPCGASPVALAEDARQRVVVAVTACLRTDDEGVFALVRLGRDGRLDHTFGSGGRAFVRMGGESTYTRAEAMLRLADGRLVVAGATIEGGRGPNRVAITRLLPDGRVDRTFGRNGRAYAWVRGIEKVKAIFRVRLGRILVAGCAGDGPFLLRFNADGSRDRGFWPPTNVVRYGGAFGRSCPRFAQTSDNGVVVLGSVLARLDRTGTIDPGFGSIALPRKRPASALVVAPDDWVYVAGTQVVRGRRFVTVARYSR